MVYDYKENFSAAREDRMTRGSFWWDVSHGRGFPLGIDQSASCHVPVFRAVSCTKDMVSF